MINLRQNVDDLFGLFEQGEWDQAAKLFAKDAQIIGQYGQAVSVMTVADFIQNAKHGLLSKLGKPKYLDRRVALFDENGFVEQHDVQLTVRGKVIKIPVCLVGKFNEEGAIILLEEYLDPAPIMMALNE